MLKILISLFLAPCTLKACDVTVIIEKPEQSRIQLVPSNQLEIIFSFLDHKSLGRLSATCRDFKHLSEINKQYWKIAINAILPPGVFLSQTYNKYIKDLHTYSFRDLGPLKGDRFSNDLRVSEDGSTVLITEAENNRKGVYRPLSTKVLRLSSSEPPVILERCHPNAISYNGSDITGWCQGPLQKAFRWNKETGIELFPREEKSTGLHISKDGSIVYGYLTESLLSFEWERNGNVKIIKKCQEIEKCRRERVNKSINVFQEYSLFRRGYYLYRTYDHKKETLGSNFPEFTVRKREGVENILKTKGVRWHLTTKCYVSGVLPKGWHLTTQCYVSEDGGWLVGLGYPPHEIGWVFYGTVHGWLARIPLFHDKQTDIKVK